MSRRNFARWPVWLAMIGAAALMSLPLPDFLSPVRPAWATLVVIYWIMMWPGRFGIGSAWLIGLLVDVLQGDTLGQHALALTVVAYITLRFHLQIRIFPLWQLTATVFALLNDFRRVSLWSTRFALDPDTSIVFSGPVRGVDARMDWNGPVIGGGNEAITESRPWTFIATALDARGAGFAQHARETVSELAPDLVELVRQLDRGIEAAGGGRRVGLSFLAHSLGNSVVTEALRVLVDAFEPESVEFVPRVKKKPKEKAK